ncbi:zinc finger Ran-binding domain-containing protein 2-like isoform X2 [Clytia hemisphaerica]
MDGIDEEEEDREKEDLEEKITELFHQQNRQEEHGRSMSLAERATAEKINPHHLHHTKGGRNRKSGSFSGALSASARETSKKLSSKSSLTSSNISPRKIGSTTTSKSNHSSFGSGARLSSKKSSTHSTSTKRPK